MLDYICSKYIKFINEHRYIPKYFNVYNCSEIKDFAPSLTIGCGRPDKTGSVLIFEVKKDAKNIN